MGFRPVGTLMKTRWMHGKHYIPMCQSFGAVQHENGSFICWCSNRIKSHQILHSPSELRGFLAQLEDCPDSFNDADSGGIDSDEV